MIIAVQDSNMCNNALDSEILKKINKWRAVDEAKFFLILFRSALWVMLPHGKDVLYNIGHTYGYGPCIEQHLRKDE